jgi:hypothetical protein
MKPKTDIQLDSDGKTPDHDYQFHHPVIHYPITKDNQEITSHHWNKILGSASMME